MFGSGVSLRSRNRNKKRNVRNEKKSISEREKNEKILKERIQ